MIRGQPRVQREDSGQIPGLVRSAARAEMQQESRPRRVEDPVRHRLRPKNWSGLGQPHASWAPRYYLRRV